jgi:tetratricopeptide (TPR) repeat protein
MSQAASSSETPPRPDEERPQAQRRSVLADPVVRILLFVSIGLLILYLATVLGVLATGVTEKTGPRSLAEKDLMVAAAQVSPQSVGEAWAPYINALVRAGDLPTARVALTKARASVVGTMSTSDLDLAEARLFNAEKKYTQAAIFADRAIEGYKSEPTTATAKGVYSSGYYEAALLRAYLSEKVGQWKAAVAMFDIYLRQDPTASDIFIDRGNAKLQLNDKKGAEADFREALKYVPYDAEAKAGLKKIGVAQ